MAEFDVSNDKGLEKLDQHLAPKSYIGGYVPSKSDETVFAKFSSAPAAKYVNVSRWYKHIASFNSEEKGKWQEAAAEKKEEKKEAKQDEDLDLFGDDGDDEEAKKELERRNKEAEEKKKEKEGGKKEKIAKSSVVLAIKTWDAETPMEEVEKRIREIQMDGLSIGGSKTEEIGFGIKKLLVNFIVVDDVCSVDDLQEKIQSLEDIIQS